MRSRRARWNRSFPLSRCPILLRMRQRRETITMKGGYSGATTVEVVTTMYFMIQGKAFIESHKNQCAPRASCSSSGQGRLGMTEARFRVRGGKVDKSQTWCLSVQKCMGEFAASGVTHFDTNNQGLGAMADCTRSRGGFKRLPIASSRSLKRSPIANASFSVREKRFQTDAVKSRPNESNRICEGDAGRGSLLVC